VSPVEERDTSPSSAVMADVGIDSILVVAVAVERVLGRARGEISLRSWWLDVPDAGGLAVVHPREDDPSTWAPVASMWMER